MKFKKKHLPCDSQSMPFLQRLESVFLLQVFHCVCSCCIKHVFHPCLVCVLKQTLLKNKFHPCIHVFFCLISQSGNHVKYTVKNSANNSIFIDILKGLSGRTEMFSFACIRCNSIFIFVSQTDSVGTSTDNR